VPVRCCRPPTVVSRWYSCAIDNRQRPAALFALWKGRGFGAAENARLCDRETALMFSNVGPPPAICRPGRVLLLSRRLVDRYQRKRGSPSDVRPHARRSDGARIRDFGRLTFCYASGEGTDGTQPDAQHGRAGVRVPAGRYPATKGIGSKTRWDHNLCNVWVPCILSFARLFPQYATRTETPGLALIPVAGAGCPGLSCLSSTSTGCRPHRKARDEAII
jgi:hypothetical protein